VFDGEPGGWPKFISHWLLRSVLIMPGLVIGGIRDRRIIPAALASSTFVSLFLVFYTAVERGRRGIPVGRTRNNLRGSRAQLVRGARRALGTRYRVSVRTPKLSGTTSICVEAKNKAEATALIHGSGRGVRVTRITRGC
jgi:hypothetical protein